MNWGMIIGITFIATMIVLILVIFAGMGYMQGSKEAYKRGLKDGIEIARKQYVK